MRQFTILCFIGLIAGTIFGVILKGVEHVTHKKVYTLLLNVDYFPVLKDMMRTELFDFSLHLIISMILVIVLYFSLQIANRAYHVIDYVWINIAIAVILYMTTTFSKQTPALTDVVAFVYWVGGHIIFGLTVGGMVRYMKKMV